VRWLKCDEIRGLNNLLRENKGLKIGHENCIVVIQRIYQSVIPLRYWAMASIDHPPVAYGLFFALFLQNQSTALVAIILPAVINPRKF
jgi:hypothetical protein